MSQAQASLLDVIDAVYREANAKPYRGQSFDGSTFDVVYDFKRLDTQLNRVYQAMKDGGWWTLRELAQVTGGSEASVSARIRDLKKKRFGGYPHNSRRRGDPKSGVWQYQLITNGDSGAAR